ncbi:UNVERIFIED_CONTAM: hypothetical protein PYX00_004608 [Menopon gallinae]|uniref:Uncharacterized protein n=1 Tax=Menopon gallinae TaxID=328185 RepID=A0AAW2I721_9NEOP
MSKVLFSLFLLMVLQVFLTEGQNTTKTTKPGADVCPPGMAADKTGKCILNQSIDGCPLGFMKDSKEKCVPKVAIDYRFMWKVYRIGNSKICKFSINSLWIVRRAC